MSKELELNQADFIEAIRAQRTEALDQSASWFTKFVAASKRIAELEAELAALRKKKMLKVEAPA